jgi:tetratricopeptide (TPR) repeat protein
MLVKSDGNWFIRDNGSRNGVVVNGEPVKECWLKNGDVIQLGAYVMRFGDGSAPEAAPAPAGEMELIPAVPAQATDGMAGFGIPGATPAPKRGLNKRVLIYGGAALLLGLVYMSQSGSDDEKTDKDKAAVTEAGGKLARDFKAGEEPKLEGAKDPNTLKGIEDPVLKRAEQEMAKLDWTNSSLRQAEQFFRRGQREYLEHNYHRAIDYFQTALSLYRGHMLADQYLRRAVFEAEIEAKKNMELGIRYFESLQYQRAIYHFNEVVSLMAHRPTEPIVGEAERYSQQAKRRLQAAELFP